MKLYEKVIKELENGPATARDISDELEIGPDKASAVLSQLRQMEIVIRCGARKFCKHGRVGFIYKIKIDGEVEEDNKKFPIHIEYDEEQCNYNCKCRKNNGWDGKVKERKRWLPESRRGRTAGKDKFD